MRYLDTLDTPLGTLQIEATERGLCGIWFPSRSINQGPTPGKTGSFPGQAGAQRVFRRRPDNISVPSIGKAPDFRNQYGRPFWQYPTARR